MKQLIPALALIAMFAVGCANDKKISSSPTLTENAAVAEVTPTTPAVTSTPTQAPSDATAVSSTPTQTSTPVVTGGSYKVKPHDTLYGIAKSRYGDGKQYTRIVAANPGLSAQNLKAGQTITIP